MLSIFLSVWIPFYTKFSEVPLIAIFLTTIGTMACIGSLSDNKVSFLSNLITIGITVAIFYITIHNEKRKEYKLARKNALLLSEILDSITKQLSQIDNGYKIIVSVCR